MSYGRSSLSIPYPRSRRLSRLRGRISQGLASFQKVESRLDVLIEIVLIARGRFYPGQSADPIQKMMPWTSLLHATQHRSCIHAGSAPS